MWYQQMLDRAQKEGVVLQTKSLHDEYFKPDPDRLFSADYPTCLPYFEGDYIPGELENIIKDVNKNEEDRREKKEKIALATHKRKDSSGKPAGKKKGTRSNPGDLVGVKPDKVMLRFGQAMSNMKQNFFVVYLRSRKFAHAVDRGDDVSNWTEKKELSALVDVKLGVNGKKETALDAAIGSTSDVDPPIESELFDSRQQFLNYCQTNHYQFDETRRAKHTTMMVLYHMHDPAAPKFLSQCGACYREITHGVRHHCESCSNFDLCDECYKPVTTGLWARKDKRFAHDESHNFTPIDMETPSESKTQRQERRKSIKAHLELLEHCGTCSGRPKCTSSNCHRMRGLFTHLRTCKLTYRKGCKTCSRFIALLSMHAKQCSVRHSEHCKIPFCDPIRERNYRLRQQQQLMDDRRRAAQNKLYRGGSERKVEI
jgi:E1A/CREB-binding protein